MTRTHWHGGLKVVYFNIEQNRYCMETEGHDPRRTRSYYASQADMVATDWEFARS